MMSAQRRLFVDQFKRMAPQQPPEAATVAADQLLRASLLYHLALAFVFVVLAAFVLYRRNWARILLTIVLTAGMFGTAFSFSSPTPAPVLYKSLNVVSWFLGASALALMWASRSARAFFDSRHGHHARPAT